MTNTPSTHTTVKKFADELKKAAAKDVLRLHTPGHKGKLAPLDLTELTDGSFPDAALAEAQRRAAKAYGAKHARYLCGGSSQGVKSAIYFARTAILADVNSHRSVIDGVMLAGVPCVMAGERGGVMPLTVEQIRGALKPETKAVVVTTPTYYGYCADITGIAEFCRSRGLVFICDSAHGAHFGFSDKLPKSVAPYCDICNVSTHKTLSALTQSALLLDNLNDDNSIDLGRTADIMGSTSPSYLLYASIDYAVRKATEAQTSAAYDALYAPIETIKREYPFLHNDDFTRLVLDCAALGVDSQKLNSKLCEQGVYSERVDRRYIIFIFTAENVPDDVQALSKAIAKAVREI